MSLNFSIAPIRFDRVRNAKSCQVCGSSSSRLLRNKLFPKLALNGILVLVFKKSKLPNNLPIRISRF